MLVVHDAAEQVVDLLMYQAASGRPTATAVVLTTVICRLFIALFRKG